MTARRAALVLLLAASALTCSRPGGPDQTSDEFGAGSVVFIGGIKCPVATSAEPLPARSDVTMSDLGNPTGDIFFTSTLFGRFKSVCGSCHVDGNSGGFVVTLATFGQQVTQQVLDDYVKSDDSKVYMPPANDRTGKPYSLRGAGDPVVQLVGLLELWISQGSPSGSFSLNPSADGGAGDGALTDGGETGTGTTTDGGNADADTDGGTAPAPSGAAPLADYTLTPAMGGALTNIGTCIPSKYIVGLDSAPMDDRDAFFAAATELPDTLDETDLTTFDSDALARRGVISYAPAYPLWSDAAGKMRHVRTPRGQPIVFDKATQRFDIPPNTRFYKTFFKEVVDASGNQAWKRIETRLIVARPDQTQPDGTVKSTALFGTYVWNESETKAELLKDPLRNGEPFADRMITYVTDEAKAAAIIASTPPGTNIDYVLEFENPGLVRHYGLPGANRCIQCHMGSPSASFIIGFTPLQVATFPTGKSGVIEPTMGDELTQLKRLIDYRVIVGVDKPADVLPLEQSQLPRTPRNDYELAAQAYLVGNCSHCHNPRGFPSTKAPDLKEVLNFLPGPDGGIFQFPLDRTSPVRARGLNQDVPIPYITPSLRDIPIPSGSAPKYAEKYRVCGPASTDGWCGNGQAVDFFDAPWRSLIYRNVDTPFDYVEDQTIFPHMPMNTPGYDCRAPRILGEWMVSIPAVRINASFKEDAVPETTSEQDLDKSPQPYVEVLPSDSGYAAAKSAATKRLAAYHAGHRYSFCPDTTDIVDPTVLLGNAQTPVDTAIGDLTVRPPQLIMPADGIPNRPHWVSTDETDPPGDWLPRGLQWSTALIDHQAVVTNAAIQDVVSLKQVVDDLQGLTLDAATRTALTTELPFGIWKQKPGCDFSGVPTAGDFQGANRPIWMDVVPPEPAAAVYMQSAGAAVYTNICVNCHGPAADAKGLLADEISIMTGGGARVANFRTGLFGPLGAPGTNRQTLFGPAIPAPSTITPDDLGARYLAWMALGGTQKIIPQDLLTLVAGTPVVGQRRQTLATGASPNMLQLVQELCTHVLLANVNANGALNDFFFQHGTLDWTHQTSLIGSNGDAELWMRVCSLGNRPVVRVAVATGVGWIPNTPAGAVAFLPNQSLYWGTGDGAPDGAVPYPSTAPVLDHRGQVRTGITPDNLFPVCLKRPSDPTSAGYAEDFRQRHPIVTPGNLLPYCPPELFANAADGTSRWRLATASDSAGVTTYADAKAWALRGAVEAGVAVFLYVDQLSKGLVAPKPLYNQCESLGR